MSPEEESALRLTLWEQFQTKADLQQERRCIDRAVNRLRDCSEIFATPEKVMSAENKVTRLATIVDDAIRYLSERRSKP